MDLRWEEDTWPDFPKVHVDHWMSQKWHVKRGIHVGQILATSDKTALRVLRNMSRDDILEAFRMAWCLSDKPIAVYGWMQEAGIAECVER